MRVKHPAFMRLLACPCWHIEPPFDYRCKNLSIRGFLESDKNLLNHGPALGFLVTLERRCLADAIPLLRNCILNSGTGALEMDAQELYW
jgi:hypothetical protein